MVNLSSGLGYTPTATEPAYVATKAAVLALSQCLRADWARGPHEIMVEADAYRADIDQVPGVRRLTGADLLGRWARKLGPTASVQVQAYYDRTQRSELSFGAESATSIT